MKKKIEAIKTGSLIDRNKIKQKVKADLLKFDNDKPNFKKISDLKEYLNQTSMASEINNIWQQSIQIQKARQVFNKKQFEKSAEETNKIFNQRKTHLQEKLKPQEYKPPISKDKFLVNGKIMDKKTKVGIPNLKVSIYDKDLIFDDLLGVIETNEDGYFEIEYAKEQFKEIFDKKPDVYIEVLDQKGNKLYKSKKWFHHAEGKVEIANIDIDGKKVPEELEKGKANKTLIEKELLINDSEKQLILNRQKLRIIKTT